jgi:hypothetical protein
LQNKFEKLVHLVGFIIRNLPPESPPGKDYNYAEHFQIFQYFAPSSGISISWSILNCV